MRSGALRGMDGAHLPRLDAGAKALKSFASWLFEDPEILELTASEPLSLEEEYEMQKSWQDSEDRFVFTSYLSL